MTKFYSSNIENRQQLTPHIMYAKLYPEHGDRIVTIDYYDVTSPYCVLVASYSLCCCNFQYL